LRSIHPRPPGSLERVDEIVARHEFEADAADAPSDEFEEPACDICDRTFPTFASLDSHLTGRSHAAGLLAHDRGVERALLVVDRILACVEATRPAERYPVEPAPSEPTIWSRTNPTGTLVNPLHTALLDSLRAHETRLFHDQSRREWRSFVASIRKGVLAMLSAAAERTVDQHIQQDEFVGEAEFEGEDRCWSDLSEDNYDDYQDQENEQFE